MYAHTTECHPGTHPSLTAGENTLENNKRKMTIKISAKQMTIYGMVKSNQHSKNIINVINSLIPWPAMPNC